MKPNYRDTLYRKTFTYNKKRYYITAKTEKEMMRKYLQKLEELHKGEIVINKNTTVDKYVQQWLLVEKKPKVQQSTYLNIEQIIKNHVIPEVGTKSLCDVTREDLQIILNKEAGKSFSHLSKIKIYITELFEIAERDGYIQKNPAKFLFLPEYSKGTTVALTDTEYFSALEVCKSFTHGTWILLMLRCGLRRCETIPLTWDNIDFEERLLYINNSVEFIKGKPYLKNSTKTFAGVRVLEIPDDLFESLKNHKKVCTTNLLFSADGSEKMYSEEQVNTRWRSFKRALDIHMGAVLYRNKIIQSKVQPKLTLKCLRHTAITRLVMYGANVKDVQYFAGHANVETTLNIYTHIEKSQSCKRIGLVQNKLISGTNSGTN